MFLAQETRYAYAVGRIRALEIRLLDRAKLDRLLEAKSAEELLKLLGETEYAEAAAGISSPWEYEDLIAAELQRVRQLLGSLSPDPELTGAFYARYDFHNARVYLKFLWGATFDPREALSPLGILPLERVEDLVKAEKAAVESEGSSTLAAPPSAAVRPEGRGTGEGSWGEVALASALQAAVRQAAKAFQASRDPQEIDLILDVQAQEYLLAVAERYRAGFLRGYLQREADLLNLQSVLRAAQMGWEASALQRALLPGGALPCARLVEALGTAPRSLLTLAAGTEYQSVVEEGVRALEQSGQLGRFALLKEHFLHNYVRAARYVFFGYVPLLAYALTKEREGRLLRLAFAAKLQALPLEKIAERLDALCPGSRSLAIKTPSWAFGPSGSIPSRFGM